MVLESELDESSSGQICEFKDPQGKIHQSPCGASSKIHQILTGQIYKLSVLCELSVAKSLTGRELKQLVGKHSPKAPKVPPESQRLLFGATEILNNVTLIEVLKDESFAQLILSDPAKAS